MSVKGVILQVLYSSVKHYNKEDSKILFHILFETKNIKYLYFVDFFDFIDFIDFVNFIDSIDYAYNIRTRLYS